MNNKPITSFALTITAAVLLSMSTASQAQTDEMAMPSKSATMSTVTAADKKFFSKAAMSGMTEIEAGKMAATQGSSEEVRMFGQKMVTDHTKAANELMALAAQKNVSLPAELDNDHQMMLNSMKRKQGAEFDAAFAAGMKKGHEEAIKNFTAGSASKDAEIASYAKMTLPTLKEHQMHIPMMAKMPDKVSGQ